MHKHQHGTDQLLKKIALAAKRDERRRRDLRYLEVMGFLTAKGFLITNQKIVLLPNRKIAVETALWAGRNVEPRILEVLPAAIVRFANHFYFVAKKHPDLAEVVKHLKSGSSHGPDYHGIPFRKLRLWNEVKLADGRCKPLSERKVARTFRLHPSVIAKLAELVSQYRCTETVALEKRVLGEF